MLKKSPFLPILVICLLAIGCSTTPPSLPLDQETRLNKLVEKDPSNNVFVDYLAKHGFSSIKEWDLETLTLSALFFHSKFDVAKEKLALANLDTARAGIKNTPTINADFARSDQSNGDISPWSYGLSFDIPINTNNKREIRIENAQINTDIVRLDIAETAWQQRNQIAMDLVNYHQNLATTQLLQEAVNIQTNITSMLEKRVVAGIASRTELSHATLLLLGTKHDLNNHLAATNLIETRLAAHVGLTPEKFSTFKIKSLNIDTELEHQGHLLDQHFTFQENALLNRIDIRRSIAAYAKAEAELKLEAAKQIPDISLSPGFLFEFGDRIWSLGFSSLLNMFQNNHVMIERAKQLRALEGAAFENLQAKVIADVNVAYAEYLSAKQSLNQTEQALSEQNRQEQKMQKQFDAGLIGKLDLFGYKINTLTVKKQYITSQFKLLQAVHKIEDVMQKPLYSDLNMPLSTIIGSSDDE